MEATILALVDAAGVMFVITYLLTRTRMYYMVFSQTTVFKNQLALILIFGLFAIYATRNGIPTGMALTSLRISGPLIGSVEFSSPCVMIEEILTSVRTFIAGAQQSDDITMMVVSFNDRPKSV